MTRGLRARAMPLYAFLVVVGAAPLLRALGLRRSMRLLAWLARRSGTGAIPREPLAYALDIAALTRGVAAYSPFRARCLEHSITVWYFLLRKGVAGELVLGTRLRGEAVDHHAWVALGGRIVTEVQSPEWEYVPFEGAGDLLAGKRPPGSACGAEPAGRRDRASSASASDS